MKTYFLIGLLVLFFSHVSVSQAGAPFGTSSVDEFRNTINPTDPTTFVNSVYEGRGERFILDRRLEEETEVNVYLFRTNYADGPSIEFLVNPEFGSVEASSTQVDIYAPILGRLPFALRVGLKVIWLNAGEGTPAIGTAGVLIHTDTAQAYGDAVEELLIHEVAHVSTDPLVYNANASLEWTQAQEADGAYISDYALNNPYEDAAESFAFWLYYRFKSDRISAETAKIIGETMPNRIKVLDRLKLNMRPLDDSPFPINPGLNGSWFNPATAGQGFFIEVFPDKKLMFVAWFTFDTEETELSGNAIVGMSEQRWLTAFGDYEGETAILTIEVTGGGVFDKEQPPAITEESDGVMIITFDDCTKGLVSYEIPSLKLEGQIPIRRIALDNVTLCGALTAVSHD